MEKKNETIAVIGGGLSGLMIAKELIRSGYAHVTVFEKEYRLGGKLHSINHQGLSYELGANFGLPSHFHLRTLMKRLGVKEDGPKISRVNYDAKGQKTMPLKREELTGFLAEIERLPEVLKKYTSLDHREILEVDEELALPFSSWCTLYDFKVLKNIYAHYFTIFGLGSVEYTPALYVHRILSFEHLMSFMELPEFTTWKDGVSIIIEKLKEGLPDLRLGQEVRDISRSDEGKVRLHTVYEEIDFDHVILAAPLDIFKNADIFSAKIRKELTNIRYQKFNVYVFEGENLPKGCGCVIENLNEERNGHMLIWNARWERKEGKTLITLYAYDTEDKKKESAIEILKKDLEKFGVKEAKLYAAMHWKHSPYVSEKVLKDGFYKNLTDYQGTENIYLAGEIMSTASMDNCIAYAEFFVEKYFRRDR